MKKLMMIALFLSAGQANAIDSGAVVGGAIGGAAGAAIGYDLGGKNGAILGGAIGGATGAAVGSTNNNTAPSVIQQTQTQPVSYRQAEGDSEYRDHDNGRHLGERKKQHRKKHERSSED